jgi:hypothetical protein
MFLSIDPGSTESAYVVCREEDLKPMVFGKVENTWLISHIASTIKFWNVKHVAIELMQCIGGKNSGVGKETFETCYFIGELSYCITHTTKIKEIVPIYRNDEKIGICGTMMANDSLIRMALIEKYAKHDFKGGKGTKSNPDWFFGFKADIWQAYAQCHILKLKLEGKM